MQEDRRPFRDFLREEIEKTKGKCYPVNTNLLLRMIVGSARVDKLHPNPEDEFCLPEVGPDEEIISRYTQELSMARKIDPGKLMFPDPLIVLRVKPKGYMILNGHHRWAAAWKLGERRIKVQIVNLTMGKDIERAMKNSQYSKRLSMDLDEVVFAGDNPLKGGELRPETVSLLRFFSDRLYDIWLYSAHYYSVDSIQRLFRRYQLRIDGIVTGNVEGRPGIEEVHKNLDTLGKKYKQTVHIDGQSVLCIDREQRQFREYPLSGSQETWAREIMDVI